ncbi:hypothetical protein GDO81_025893 [Engystomops pustulosus]|uniref:Taste receptor type 2 n=1 Tax=Engystomops pustulosus TaxID=76066 RepID=A0AAV6ZL76_ENGPU|nr:hypothetical protein GDO81_025893 [Engystomops pustulosus]
MADTTESDSKLIYLILLVPGLMALIAGLVIHSFIIGVNVSDWWRGRSVTPVDLIVTSLGMSRICSQSTITLYLIVFTFFVNSLDSHVSLVIIYRMYAFFTYMNIWLTSLLSIVLCLKISNLHTRLFLYLRRIILHRTGRLIVVFGILSALNSLLSLLLATTKAPKNGTYNDVIDGPFTDCSHITSIYAFAVGGFFPLLFYSMSSVLLFVSLYHHTTRMKMSSNLSINLETYYSVMNFISCTFLYNTLYFIGHFVTIFYYYFYCINFTWILIVLGILSLPHSSYLIYKTAKLRSQMFKVLQDVTGFFFQSRNSENIENIEIVSI